MINRKLKEDWLRLLEVNKSINKSETPEAIQEIIAIPFTPLKVDAQLLYFLSEYFYPKFINDQKNVVDIIISDYDIDDIAFNAFLYKTSRLGIYDSVESIPKDDIAFKQRDMSNLEQLFINIQSTIIKKKNIRIASVRFFRKRSIDLINRYYEELEKYTPIEFFTHLFELIQKLIKEELIIIYPEPNIIVFLRSLFSVIGNLKISEIVKKIFDILPLFNQIIIFHSKESDFMLHFKKFDLKKENNLELTLTGIKINKDTFDSKPTNNKLFQLQKEFKNDKLLTLKLESLTNFLLELSELRIPFNKEKLKLILQKGLYAFSSIGTHWNINPRPKIYSTFIRFLIRLFGFNLNLRKISYWAIPEFICYILDSYLGLNYKIAFLLTDNGEIKHLFSLACQNGTPLQIIPIKQKDIVNSELSSIWKFINNNYGFHVILLKIDITLIRKLLDNFVFQLNKIGFFSFLSVMRMVKKPKYFDFFPDLPPFQIIKKKNSLSLMKLLLNNIIDKYEF
jgi:hypothetical protein